MGRGSNSNKLWRPVRRLCTIPARSNTRRCLVIACRVSFEPSVSWAMEAGFPRESLATNDNLVLSPNAAKTEAGTCACRRAATLLLFLGDMAGDVFDLRGPTPIVHAKSFRPATGGDLVKAGLGDR